MSDYQTKARNSKVSGSAPQIAAHVLTRYCVRSICGLLHTALLLIFSRTDAAAVFIAKLLGCHAPRYIFISQPLVWVCGFMHILSIVHYGFFWRFRSAGHISRAR